MDTKTSPSGHQVRRTEVRWPVAVFAGHGQFDARTENISADGVFISCQESLPMEGNFGMLIKAPNRHPLKVTARLVWTTLCSSESDTVRLGAEVRFVDISDKDRQFLGNVIERHYGKKTAHTGGKRDPAIGSNKKSPKRTAQSVQHKAASEGSGYDAVPVKISTRLHLADVARALGTDFDALKKLNPEIPSYSLPAGHHTLRVPCGLGFKMPFAVNSLNRKAAQRKNTSDQYYVVRSGDTLRDIARKTGVSPANLSRLNRIHGSTIKVGQKLLLSRGKRY